MKIGNLLLLAGGGFLLWQVIQTGVGVNTVQIVFNGVQPQGALNYTLTFLIQNVSNASATLNALTGAVYINGNLVGNLSNFTPVAIPATSQQSVNVNLQLSVLGSASEVVQQLQSSGQTLNFEVKGNANVGGLVIPFDLTNAVTI